MLSLFSTDTALFYFLNRDIAHPLLDIVMKFLSGNAMFFPTLLAISLFVVWKNGLRGLSLVFIMILAALIVSNGVCGPLKEWLARPRPAMTLDAVRLVSGNGHGLAMPSCHSANWGALAMIAWLYYRSTWKFMVPLALLVGFSRIYLGVHYPSDVIVGLLIGAGTGAAVAGICAWLWRLLGSKIFPSWWLQCPSFLKKAAAPPPLVDATTINKTWRNATWSLLIVLLIARLFYIGSGTIELSEDEAYQWMWSQRLDWAYYSKPPMIAWVQWLGTHLWGNTAFGVRFFSPVLAFLFGIMVWAFLRKQTSERTTFWAVAVFAATPLFAVGSTLLTVDAPTVFFYTASLLAMWTAMEKDSTRWWVITGLCLALGFLSKFFSPFLWVGLLLFLVWTPQYRGQLKRPGIWLAVAINALGFIPVAVWNASHGWITMTHLKERGGLDQNHSINFATFGEFFGSIAGLLNPVFFLAALLAVWGFVWMKNKPSAWRFLFCASVPVFIFYMALAFRAKAQPNWIGPAAPALFLLVVCWWHYQNADGFKAPKRWLAAGLALGLPMVIFLHDTKLVNKALGIKLSEKADPLNRVRGGHELAKIVAKERAKLEKEGSPVFLIADHYGSASLLNFYTPEAHELLPEKQLAYVLSSDKPQNQYWFWPSYESRIGDNAIFVMHGSRKKAPKRLRDEFTSVESLGVFELKHKKRVTGRVQLFACREKKPPYPNAPEPLPVGNAKAVISAR